MNAVPIPIPMQQSEPDGERRITVEQAVALAAKFFEAQCVKTMGRKLGDFEVLEAVAHHAGHVIVRCRHRCLLQGFVTHELAFDSQTGELLALRKLLPGDA